VTVARRAPEPRAELPATAYAVLGLLAFGRELSGYDLKRWADNSLRFFYWSPAGSQIYGELRRLERLGFVTSNVVRETMRGKRLYRISPAGRAALQEWLHTEPEPTILKHNALLRVWLGHLADPDELRAVVAHHRASVEALLADARFADEHATDDPRWAYPTLVTRWTVGYLEHELKLMAELVAGLDRLERKRVAARRRAR
jgi:DNA-binding PadR family transcriptional regulator